MPETTQVFRIVIHGSIEDVWREITKTDEPIACFFNSRMEVSALRPGSRLAMRTPNNAYTGVVGEILEVRPYRRFSHTFRFTHLNEPACKVIYDLEQVEGGVEFTLTIEALPVGTKSAKQMVQGGPMIVNTLKAVIETGRPSLGTRALFALFRVMQPFTPKKCRTEHWPVAELPASKELIHE